MPDWTPNWTDVAFDHAAAAAAAEQCDAMALRLREAAAERDRLAVTARDEWTGRYRRDFDAAYAALRDDGTRIEADLRALAAAIRSASTAAAAEQRARVASRQQWNREQAAEEARGPAPLGPGPR